MASTLGGRSVTKQWTRGSGPGTDRGGLGCKTWNSRLLAPPRRSGCNRAFTCFGPGKAATGRACTPWPELRYPRSVPEQYVASDKRTGLEVAVTGEFPPHPDDRVRIARTCTLFTRLMSTILATENDGQRRERFMAIETQLEMAEALIREDMQEVQRLLQSTMEKMGINKQELDELARKILDQLGGGGDTLPPGENPLFPGPGDNN